MAGEIRKKNKRDAQERQRQELLRQSRNMVLDFLEKNGFEDVNDSAAMNVSCIGFRSYETPLHKAAKEGNVMMLKLLVQFGADPHKTDSRGKNVFRCLILKVSQFICRFFSRSLDGSMPRS